MSVKPKQIMSVRLAGGTVERVLWVEDGSVFSHDDPADKIARAIKAGEAYYLKNADGTLTPVTVRIQHGRHFLMARPDPAEPDRLLAMPTF